MQWIISCGLLFPFAIVIISCQSASNSTLVKRLSKHRDPEKTPQSLNNVTKVNWSHTSTDSVAQQWLQIENSVEQIVFQLVYETLLPTFDKIFKETNVSSSCQSSVLKVLTDAAKVKRYAIQILDSSGKFPPSGILEGTLTDLGRYDECLEVDETLQGLDTPVRTSIQGQYCTLILRPPLPPRPRFHTICNRLESLADLSSPDKMIRWLGRNAQYFYYAPFRIGVCTPSACSPEDVQAMVGKVASSFNLHANVMNMKCDTKQPLQLNRPQIFVISVFCLLLLLVIIGTVTDIRSTGAQKSISPSPSPQQAEDKSEKITSQNGMYWFKRTPQVPKSVTSDEATRGQWAKMVMCFSVKRNGASLLNMDIADNEDSLKVVHGMRVLTMSWVILGHTYGLVNPQIHSHAFYASDLYTNLLYQGLLNATLSVDTFFFISGLLTSYLTYKRILKTNQFQPLAFTALRYARLTPPYAFIIGFTLLFPLLGTGPLWRETVQPVADSCYKTWWTNLLYINNFVSSDQLCLMHSWYLSNDFQFHLVGLIVLYALMKSKRIAFLLLSLCMVLCTVYSGILTAINNYPPTIVSTSPAVEDRWRYILDFYYKPWPHLPSYCIGLILGYALASKKTLNLNITQKRICWTVFPLTSLLVLYGVYPWNMGWTISSVVTALYSSTFRTLWTASCAWMTFALLTGNDKGFLVNCLSWKGLIPFSRLTYMAYLVHPFVIWYHSGTMRERFYATHFNQFHLFMGHYFLTYIASFFVGLLVESPFMALTKHFVDGEKPKSSAPGPGQSLDKTHFKQSSVQAKDKKRPEALRSGSFMYHVSFNQTPSRPNVLYVNQC